MTAGAAAGVEHALSLEELRFEGIHPVQELLLEFRVHFGEVLPLPAERGCRPALLFFEIRWHETGNSVPDRPATAAAVANELAALHIVRPFLAFEDERIGRDGTAQVFDQRALHAAPRSSDVKGGATRLGRSIQRRCQSWKTKSVHSGLR